VRPTRWQKHLRAKARDRFGLAEAALRGRLNLCEKQAIERLRENEKLRRHTVRIGVEEEPCFRTGEKIIECRVRLYPDRWYRGSPGLVMRNISDEVHYAARETSDLVKQALFKHVSEKMK
jgi:hypothetical protein